MKYLLLVPKNRHFSSCVEVCAVKQEVSWGLNSLRDLRIYLESFSLREISVCQRADLVGRQTGWIVETEAIHFPLLHKEIRIIPLYDEQEYFEPPSRFLGYVDVMELSTSTTSA